MSDQAITTARTHWALGDAAITLIAARENHVYRVDAPDGPLALRVHRPGYRTLAEIEAELLWMNMLANNGIAVPKPIPATNGSYYKRFNDITVSVLSWLDGTPWSKLNLTPQMYYQLGAELANMHTLADSWSLPSDFNRPTWNLIGEQPTWGRFWENPHLSQAKLKQLLTFRDAAQDAIERMGELDFGLIHADLVPDNVLLHDNELQYIDFDDGGFGYRLFDLATITRKSRIINSSGALATATLKGYAEKRPIDEHALRLFEALRACTYIGWNITRIEEPNGLERNERFFSEALAAIERFHKFLT